MIYRLIVNAAFLAVGYYIGKEVGRMAREDESSETPSTGVDNPRDSGPHPADEEETA